MSENVGLWMLPSDSPDFLTLAEANRGWGVKKKGRAQRLTASEPQTTRKNRMRGTSAGSCEQTCRPAGTEGWRQKTISKRTMYPQPMRCAKGSNCPWASRGEALGPESAPTSPTAPWCTPKHKQAVGGLHCLQYPFKCFLSCSAERPDEQRPSPLKIVVCGRAGKRRRERKNQKQKLTNPKTKPIGLQEVEALPREKHRMGLQAHP